MSTQYDAIGTTYAAFKQLPLIPLETASVSARLGSVSGLRCLDLACGLGDWTRRLAGLGAREVVGVDVSNAMVEGAVAALEREVEEDVRERVKFVVGDAGAAVSGSSSPLLGEDARPFDLVMGNWFLNYAGDYGSLVAMFRTIATHLAPGGKFVGVTPNTFCPMFEPVDDGYGVYVEAIAEVDGTGTGEAWARGWKCRLKADVGENGVEFEMYHFMHRFYETAAAEAGLRELQWHPVVVPDTKPSEDFFDRYLLRPHMCVLTAKKPS